MRVQFGASSLNVTMPLACPFAPDEVQRMCESRCDLARRECRPEAGERALLVEGSLDADVLLVGGVGESDVHRSHHVDRISVGALTKDVKAIDFSMRLKEI